MVESILMCILLIIALFIVIKASDLFVDNIIEIGKALGVSQILLGVTAAAIGTSLPEFGSALIAFLEGNVEMGVGVVIGSNIWNVAGILGITATVTELIKADKKSINRDGLMAIITGIILLIFMAYAYFSGELHISGIGSLIMIVIYIYYMKVLVKDQENDLEEVKETKIKIAEKKEIIKKQIKGVPDLEKVMEKKKRSIRKKIYFLQ